MNFAIILAVLTTIAFVAVVTESAYASTLSLEAPPPPNLPLNGSQLNLTADDTDRDISIDPLEALPANGTQTISTAGATDIDINDFPPVGVAVIIQNDTIMVTNHTFTIANSLEEDTEQAAIESNDDGGNDDSGGSDNNEDEE